MSSSESEGKTAEDSPLLAPRPNPRAAFQRAKTAPALDFAGAHAAANTSVTAGAPQQEFLSALRSRTRRAGPISERTADGMLATHVDSPVRNRPTSPEPVREPPKQHHAAVAKAAPKISVPARPAESPTLSQTVPTYRESPQQKELGTPGKDMPKTFSFNQMKADVTDNRFDDDFNLETLSDISWNKLNLLGRGQLSAVELAAELITHAMSKRDTVFFGPPGMRGTLIRLRRHRLWSWLMRLVGVVLLIITYWEPASFRQRGTNSQYMPLMFAIEAVCLVLLTIDLITYYIHYGRKRSFSSPWKIFYGFAVIFSWADLILNSTGAITLRFARVVRPIFFIAPSAAARRAVMTILRSAPAVLLTLTGFFFFLVIFAVLGVMLFRGIYSYDITQEIPAGDYNTTSHAMVVLFALTTTENYPMILYPAFFIHESAILYYIVYSLVSMVITALTFAIGYETYKEQHTESVIRQMIKEKRNFIAAFHVLDDAREGFISIQKTRELLSSLKKLPPEILDLLCKVLDPDDSGTIDKLEFCFLADMLRWDIEFIPEGQVDNRCSAKFGRVIDRFSNSIYLLPIADSQYYEWARKVLVLANLIYVALMANEGNNGNAVEHILIFFLTFDLVMTLVRLGRRFAKSFWVRYDALVMATAFILLVLYDAGVTTFFFNITVLRAVDIFHFHRPRAVKLNGPVPEAKEEKKSTFEKLKKVLGQFAFSLRQSIQVVIALGMALLSLMYVFSIVGMELFDGALDSLMDIYSNPPANFDSWGHAFLTLYQMFLVNNFNDVMYACMQATSGFASLYFVCFYILVATLMTNLITSLVVDAFQRRLDQSRMSEVKLYQEPGLGFLKIQRKRLWDREMAEEEIGELREDRLYNTGLRAVEQAMEGIYVGVPVDFTISPDITPASTPGGPDEEPMEDFPDIMPVNDADTESLVSLPIAGYHTVNRGL